MYLRTVVHAKDACPGGKRPVHLGIIVGFHQSGKPQVLTDGKIFPQLCIVQNGTDEQYRRCTEKLCFVDHIVVHRKILTQAGRGDGGGDLL